MNFFLIFFDRLGCVSDVSNSDSFAQRARCANDALPPAVFLAPLPQSVAVLEALLLPCVGALDADQKVVLRVDSAAETAVVRGVV